MRVNGSDFLSPIKLNHNNSFLNPINDHNGTFNQNSEKIRNLQLDIENSKDTIVKLRSDLTQKSQEINNLKYNKKGQNFGFDYFLKVIEIALKIINPNIFDDEIKEEKNEKGPEFNTINNNINIKNKENDKNINQDDGQNELKINLNLNDKNLKLNNNNSLKTIKSAKKLKLNLINQPTSKELSYVNSLKSKINLLKELLIKKNDEIKEMEKVKTNINYTSLENNFQKNYDEMEKIKKQNEQMRSKIEDVSNLIYVAKEGNKNLRSKLKSFKNSFEEFQRNSEKKTIDLENKLFKYQEKERGCKIFHIRRTMEIDDSERLKLATKEMESIKMKLKILIMILIIKKMKMKF